MPSTMLGFHRSSLILCPPPHRGVSHFQRLWTYLDDRGQETSDKVTYRQLDEITKALSDNLLRGAKGRGALSRGDRVLLVYPPSLHFSIAFVACLRAGLVAVPVYPPDPRKLKKDIQVYIQGC